MSSVELSGVNLGPFGSRGRDVYGLDNSSYPNLFKDGGERLKQAMNDFKQAGSNIMATPTFNGTPCRGCADCTTAFEGKWADSNTKAVDIAAHLKEDTDQPLPALLAPILDTSGGDDSFYQSLDNPLSWIRDRQDPQIKHLLTNTAADGAWLEAGRYKTEALALADLSKEYGATILAICFEINLDGSFPDPLHPNQSFAELKQELQDRFGNKNVMIGANCFGSTSGHESLDSGNQFDIVYPNTLDFAKGEPADRVRFVKLIQTKNPTVDEQEELQNLTEKLESTDQELEAIWKRCVQQKTKVIGICCGGTPEHVKLARKVYEEHHASVAVAK